MPGLTFMIAAEGRTSDKCGLGRAQSLLLHSPDYRTNSAAEEPGFHLGWVAYEGYPVRVFPSGSCQIYLEGRIYNKPTASVEADLAALAGTALGPGRDDAGVERFILDNEGSYVVVIVRSESREVLVFSDPHCRLPLYYSADETCLIVAREAKFVHTLRLVPTFDRVGCAQVLAFGLPLGDRTVLEGVKSFPGAGLLRIELVGGDLRWSLRTLCNWNLDEEDNSKSVARQAGEFADLFLVACRNWGSHPESRGNLVSLSGGHDSRAVAAGLSRSGAGVIAVTYRHPSGKREDDLRCAQKLAEVLGIEWHCIDLPPQAESAYEELAWLKDGMNWSSMGYILRYLEEIVGRWGRHWTYLSGDGGDDCFKVTAPTHHFREVEEVVGYILRNETFIQPDQAEAILKLPAGTLRAELWRLFESYPERDLARRIKHFKIFERGRRCYFEGEDRTRSFLWQDSPFYSLPVFRNCMRVPDRQKHYNVFCRQALLALSPAAAATPVIPAGLSPASWQYVLYQRARVIMNDLPNPLVKLAHFLTRRVPKGPYVVPEPRVAYLRDQLNQDTPLAALVDGERLSQALQEFDERSFFRFWTVAMLEKAYRSRIG